MDGLVGLSGLDSNRFDCVISFKESLPTEDTHTDNISGNPREINEYGETVVKRIQQIHIHLKVEEIELLIKGYKEGKSVYQLAREFGCHRTTVGKILRRQGVNVTNCKYSKLDTSDIVTMYANMHTTAKIAEKYDVGPNVIIRCLREHGVTIRGRWDY